MFAAIAFAMRLLYLSNCDSGGSTERESPRVGVVEGGKLKFNTAKVSSSCSLNEDIDIFCCKSEGVSLLSRSNISQSVRLFECVSSIVSLLLGLFTLSFSEESQAILALLDAEDSCTGSLFKGELLFGGMGERQFDFNCSADLALSKTSGLVLDIGLMVRLIFLSTSVVFCSFSWGEVVPTSGGLTGPLLRSTLDNPETIKGLVPSEKETACPDEGDWSLPPKRGWTSSSMTFAGGLLCFLYLALLTTRKF